MQRHVITLFKTQRSNFPTYMGHKCSDYLFYCVEPTVPCGYTGGIQDPKVDEVSCGWGCSKQNVCLKPNRQEANIGLSSRGEDPLIYITWNVAPPNLRCIYDLDKIDTAAQINALMRIFPEIQVNHVMRAFCTQPVSTCSNGTDQCSRLNSLDESGGMCREWMARLPSDTYRDSVMREYCLHNNTKDCQCINRTQSKEFNSLQGEMNALTLASTRCWYKPCQDNSNLLLHVEQQQECNANICQSIIDAHAEGNVTIKGNKSSISCNFNKTLQQPPPPTPTPTPAPTPTFGYTVIICAVVGLLLVLLVSVLN